MNKSSTIYLLTALLLGVVFTGYSQKQFEGVATYQSSVNAANLEVAGEGMSPEMQANVRRQIAAQMQRTYQLKFNLQEATWEQEASLDPVSSGGGNGGVEVRIDNGGGISYVNPGKNEFLEETELFGKKFLIVDELEPFNWKITNETKQIGNYTAVKAEFMDIQEQTIISLSDAEQKNETVMDTTMITAWYTPDIPVSQGPNNTWGLPGLILELQDGDFTFLCTKVELNPSEKVVITRPTKGKKVTREDVDRIRDEKMQEMMKKYDTGEGGQMRVIQIGG